MDIRAKAILSVMLTITILTSIFVFMSIQQRNDHLQNVIQAKKESSNFLAENLQEQIFAAYKSRIVSLATTKKEVIDAFASRDREALHRAALPFYRTIMGENPYFTIMHFHLPENASFLRMHLPQLHGDDLAAIRPMVREVNRTHKQRSGYEVGKNGLFYRIVQPVFKEERYLGALEFGISHEQLVNLLRQRISPEIAVAVKSGEWQKATLVAENKSEQGEYAFLPTQNGVFGKIDPRILLDQENNRRYTVGGKTYILFSNIELQNFQKKPIAKILVAQDISGELTKARNFIIKAVLLALLLLIIASLVLYFSFGQLLTRIFNLNASLSRSNQNLTTAKAYVDNILASMNDGLLVTTAEGRISKANEALCRLLGYPEAELVEKNIASFFANPAEIEMNLARRGSEGCNISKAERRLLTKEGAGVPVLFSGTALAGETGSPPGIVCIVTDITDRKKSETALREAHDLLEHRVIERTRELAEANTALTKEMAERKRAEAELRQAQKMRAIGTLAGGIAHDFNNILTAILGYTQLAQERVKSDATCRSYMDGVFTAGLRARELVRQILTFSRQDEQEKKPIEIHLIIKEALKLLRASLPANIEIVQDIPSSCGAVLADPTQIHQVVMNLCTNAYHAMQEKGGTLTVSLGETAAANISPSLPEGDYLQLVVRDTGCGMDTSILERIFEPYFTTKEEGKGTGLGLAVTHGIVESHGGHIRVASTTGLGTTFSIYLPLHKGLPAEALEPLEKPEFLGGSERILVVDDEKEIVQLLEIFLADFGYRITSLSDSTAAYAWFCANPREVDLVITDMSMPHLTGKELATKMLALRPDLPIILCSGFSEVISEEDVKKIGIRAFFLKPFLDKVVVARLVRQVLDSGRADT
ncbi:MAG: ATP-binding protein [Desulfurivibrionaceae bacterium]